MAITRNWIAIRRPKSTDLGKETYLDIRYDNDETKGPLLRRWNQHTALSFYPEHDFSIPKFGREYDPRTERIRRGLRR